jgi:hypothetical protein
MQPILLISRQIQDDEDARDHRFRQQEVVIATFQREAEGAALRLAQIDGRFELNIERWPHRSAGADLNVDTVAIEVHDGRDVTRSGRNSSNVSPR